MFSDHNKIKTEINSKKITGKYLKSQKLSNASKYLLGQEEVSKEILKCMQNCMEMKYNKKCSIELKLYGKGNLQH